MNNRCVLVLCNELENLKNTQMVRSDLILLHHLGEQRQASLSIQTCFSIIRGMCQALLGVLELRYDGAVNALGKGVCNPSTNPLITILCRDYQSITAYKLIELIERWKWRLFAGKGKDYHRMESRAGDTLLMTKKEHQHEMEVRSLRWWKSVIVGFWMIFRNSQFQLVFIVELSEMEDL